MKELSIEGKATRYDQALERAIAWRKKYVNSTISEDGTMVQDFDNIFPELKENEDERIRKWIIENIQETLDVDGFFEGQKTMAKKALAWLEKQRQWHDDVDIKYLRMKETKPANIAEFLDRLTTVEQEFLWEHIAKIRELDKEEQKSAGKIEQKGMNIVEEDMTPFQKKVFCIIDTAIEEEQGLKQVCDELLSLASDEIIQKPAWSEEDERHVNSLLKRLEGLCRNEFERTRFAINEDEDWLKSLKDKLQPQSKQEWSEEDKKMFVNIKACLRNANKDYSREIDWLKSIKPQPKQKWSEEDEKRIKKVMHILSLDGRISNKELESILNWLKSLRPQKQWKPSDEQMLAIDTAVNVIGKGTLTGKRLIEIQEQLKKLREE